MRKNDTINFGARIWGAKILFGTKIWETKNKDFWSVFGVWIWGARI